MNPLSFIKYPLYPFPAPCVHKNCPTWQMRAKRLTRRYVVALEVNSTRQIVLLHIQLGVLFFWRKTAVAFITTVLPRGDIVHAFTFNIFLLERQKTMNGAAKRRYDDSAFCRRIFKATDTFFRCRVQVGRWSAILVEVKLEIMLWWIVDRNYIWTTG